MIVMNKMESWSWCSVLKEKSIYKIKILICLSHNNKTYEQSVCACVCVCVWDGEQYISSF